MDAILIAWRGDGQVQFEHEDWVRPSLQERRAIIHAAREEIAELEELVDALGE
jgi:hypothetical protein